MHPKRRFQIGRGTFQHVMDLRHQIRPIRRRIALWVASECDPLAFHHARHIRARKAQFCPVKRLWAEQRIEVWRDVRQHVHMRTIFTSAFLHPAMCEGFAMACQKALHMVPEPCCRRAILARIDAAVFPQQRQEAIEWLPNRPCIGNSVQDRLALMPC